MPLSQGFALGELRVNPPEGGVTGPGGTQQLDPKVMGVLVMLAEHAGHVVLREELLARLWPNAVVTDDALTRCLYELRRQLALAGGSEAHRAMVETLPKRGYRLNGTVGPLADTAPAPARRSVPWVAGAVALLAVALVAVLLWRPFSPRPAAAARPSIAVLPFTDMSETRDQQYLGDGLAEEILDKLNRSKDLRVIARTSSFWFRGKDADIAEIGRKLGVTHVLEGSVRRSGDDLRVTAQLIATHDSSHVWSTTFDRELGDLFAIQDEIAVAVASALRSTLELADLAPGSRPDVAAYDLVKQGEYLYNRRGPGDVDRSVRLFEEAARIDPAYARAWAALAGVYSLQAWNTDPPSELLKAKQGNAAHRAVELDPSLAVAQVRLAQYYFEADDPENGRKHYALARDLAPDDPLVLGFLASDALEAGDFRAAVDLQKRALRRDPMNSMVRQNLGVSQMAAGDFDDALATYRTLFEVNPDAGSDRELEISRILTLLGRHEEAAAAALRLPEGRHRDQAMALLHGVPAQRAESDAALRRLEALEPAPPDTPQDLVMDSVRLAEIYAYRGQSDKAFGVLSAKRDALASRKDAKAYLWYLRQELRIAPFLKPLHADPRWAALMKEPG